MALGPTGFANALLVLGGLIFGSFNILNMKLQFQQCVETGEGLPIPTAQCPHGGHLFKKPWMSNFVMFVGEFFVLFIYFANRWWSDSKRARAGKPPRVVEPISPTVFAVPACCDVLGSGLSAVGMTLVPAPVAVMMQSSRVLFTWVLTKFWLKKPLQKAHTEGVIVTTVGLLLVATATILDTGDPNDAGTANSPADVLLGVTLIFFSQLAGGFQGVFEEHLLQGKRVSAKKTVGLEGFWGILVQGSLLFVFWQIPGQDQGKYEDLADTVEMIRASGTVQFLLVSFALGVAGTNICAMTVTKRLSAVTRCLVGNCTTIVVWLVSLYLYYYVDHSLGASFTSHSWLQAVGFMVTVYGAFVYNGFVKSPCTKANAPAFKPWSPSGHKGLDDWEFSPAASPVGSQSLEDVLRQPLIVEDPVNVPEEVRNSVVDDRASSFVISGH